MSDKKFADRIAFLEDAQIMEVDFSGLNFDVSSQVNDFYDEVDRQVLATGQKWYFLVRYQNLTIMLEASITFAHRGKKANIAYSLGSARYAVTQDMKETIAERAEVEKFDPNVYETREEAVAYLESLRKTHTTEDFEELKRLDPSPQERSFEDRITFHADMELMEADFSDLTFERSRDVSAFYDVLDTKLEASGRKWYFMVNYRNFKIEPEAWVSFGSRGKDANLTYSKGSVRYDASQVASEAILEDARRESFDANLFPSRDAAIKRIMEMQESNAS